MLQSHMSEGSSNSCRSGKDPGARLTPSSLLLDIGVNHGRRRRVQKVACDSGMWALPNKACISILCSAESHAAYEAAL